MNLKPALELLRNLSDILHNLYMALDGDDLNGSLQSASSSIVDLISTEGGPLARCTTELRALEKVLGTEEWPVNEVDLMKTLDNLERIKVVLTAEQRLVCSSRGALTVVLSHYLGLHQVMSNRRRKLL